MAKRKNSKKQYKRWLDRNATKILCKYCDIRENCSMKERKEKNEANGVITACIFTPNKKLKKYSWAKFDKYGRIINENKNGIPIDKAFEKDKTSKKKKHRKPFKKNRKKEE